MSSDWYLIPSKPLFQSEYETDDFINYAQNGFDEMLDTFLGETVCVCDDGKYDISKLRKVIIQEMSDSKTTEEKMLVPIGTIKVGQYIIRNNDTWIVITKPLSVKFYDKVIIKQCNHLFRFQNGTADIIERWGILEKSIISIDEEKVISTLSNKLHAQLPYDKDTQRLFTDKRVFIETSFDKDGKQIPVIYKIISPISEINHYGDNRLLEFDLQFCEYGSNDNIDKQIADYIEPTTPPDPPKPELLNCDINGSDIIKITNIKRTYKPVFYLADKKTIDDSIIPKWTVELSPEQIDKVIWIQNGRFIDIKCGEFENLIGTNFTIKLTDDKGLYNVITKKVSVVSTYG